MKPEKDVFLKSDHHSFAPDIIVGFNMGLTVSEYDWASSIEAAVLLAASHDAPFLATTSTLQEAAFEQEALEFYGLTCKGLATNPFLSLETVQSGTLANDIDRRNTMLLLCEAEAPEAGDGDAGGGRGGGGGAGGGCRVM